MSVGDLVGSIGVSILLLAFGLNTTGKLGSYSPVYLSLNFLGAALACVASILIGYVPFVILEAAWSAVAAGTLLQSYRRTRSRH